MKIGIFLPNATFDQPGSAEVGGIETFAFAAGEAMQRLGHEVVLFGGKPKGERIHQKTSLALELFDYWETKSIPDIGTRFQRLVQRLHFGWVSEKRWADHQFDLALLSKPFDWPVAWWWKRRNANLRCIMGFHGTDFFATDAFWYRRAVDAAFAVSPLMADLAEKRVGQRPVLVPNPTDVDFFSPRGAQADSPCGSPARPPLRLSASGRLIGLKGFDVLIRAVAQARQEGLDVSLRIAGAGPEEARLQALIKELNLSSAVELTGRLDRDALRSLLLDSDGYVCSSVGVEAFGIAPLEAAAVGLPLILSDQVGLAAFLERDHDYLSYPARDVGALAQAVQDLAAQLNDPQWADATARHERIRDQFSARSVAERILAL